MRIVRLRHYEGRLAYLPADGERAAEAVPDYWATHVQALGGGKRDASASSGDEAAGSEGAGGECPSPVQGRDSPHAH